MRQWVLHCEKYRLVTYRRHRSFALLCGQPCFSALCTFTPVTTSQHWSGAATLSRRENIFLPPQHYTAASVLVCRRSTSLPPQNFPGAAVSFCGRSTRLPPQHYLAAAKPFWLRHSTLLPQYHTSPVTMIFRRKTLRNCSMSAKALPLLAVLCCLAIVQELLRLPPGLHERKQIPPTTWNYLWMKSQNSPYLGFSYEKNMKAFLPTDILLSPKALSVPDVL